MFSLSDIVPTVRGTKAVLRWYIIHLSRFFLAREVSWGRIHVCNDKNVDLQLNILFSQIDDRHVQALTLSQRVHGHDGGPLSCLLVEDFTSSRQQDEFL